MAPFKNLNALSLACPELHTQDQLESIQLHDNSRPFCSETEGQMAAMGYSQSLDLNPTTAMQSQQHQMPIPWQWNDHTLTESTRFNQPESHCRWQYDSSVLESSSSRSSQGNFERNGLDPAIHKNDDCRLVFSLVLINLLLLFYRSANSFSLVTRNLKSHHLYAANGKTAITPVNLQVKGR